MTDVDLKLESLFAAPAAPPDEVFITRVDQAIGIERRLLAAKSALRRRFFVELAATVAVVAAFYLLWRMSASQGGIEPLLGAPGLAAGMVMLLWLAAQFKPALTTR